MNLLRTLVLSVLLLAVPVSADVSLPAIFGDHMVLQAGRAIAFWGSADPGEKVTVKAAAQEKSATADEKGKWRITLDPIDSKTAIELAVTGKNTITFKDVLLGEVWLCSGQSNMEFSLKRASNADEAIKAADRPTIRLFKVGRAVKDQPQEDVAGGKWELCTPQTAADFSAVAYFFGVDLQHALGDVPIGLIQPSWGGTRAEAWMPRKTFDVLKLPYEPAWTQEWLHPKPNRNSTQPAIVRPHEAPAVLYNGMIAPIAGYALRGVIWYQGETNTAYPDQYRDVLAAMITSWRTAWGQGDFPFLIVQLPNFRNTRFWPTLRAAQQRVANEVPNCGLAVTIDLGNPKDIHPTNKQPVGHRLALLAEKLAYGKDVECSGPVFKSVMVDGDNAVVSFDHVAEGLVARGGEVQGFELAGPDGKFLPARAKIDGNNVLVQSEGVSSPAMVRYGWENDPTCTLYNQANLPAAPFEAKVK
jgi:sialate O-acetylesterase